jgi:basic membrane protein A and related proteins
MKKTLAVVLMVLCALSVFAGGAAEAASSSSSGQIKAILLTDATGIDDKSFNAAAWRGILAFYGDNGEGRGTLYENVTAQSEDDYLPNLKNAAEQDWDLIITTGFTWAEATQEAAALYPDQKFIIVDVDYLTKTDNLIQYIYEEEQGSYLVGVAVATQAKEDGITSPKFGFVGGVAGATITKFEIGYIEGIKSVFPDAEIVDYYVNSWGDPAAAKTAAKSMYDSGVYCIFAAAGGSGLGVINQAKEERLAGKNVWAIGVDSDQYEDGVYAEGRSAVITSMLKMVENSTLDALNKVADGTWQGGVVTQNMANEGVGYSTANSELKASAIAAADQAKADILSGRIVVNKTYAASRAAGLAPAGLAAIDD